MKQQKATPPTTLHEAMEPLREQWWSFVFWLMRHVLTPLVSFLAGVAVWLLSRGKAERW